MISMSQSSAQSSLLEAVVAAKQTASRLPLDYLLAMLDNNLQIGPELITVVVASLDTAAPEILQEPETAEQGGESNCGADDLLIEAPQHDLCARLLVWAECQGGGEQLKGVQRSISERFPHDTVGLMRCLQKHRDAMLTLHR